MIVAIDGPAGTGKSTVAKIIAKKLNITFLNSGSFYRGITLGLLRDKIDLNNEEKILEYAENLDLDYVNEHLILNGEDVNHLLHQDIISEHSSPISAIVELRNIVNKKLNIP